VRNFSVVFVAVFLLSALFGCSNNPVNSGKEQSVQPVATLSSGCTQSAAMKAWEALSQATKDYKITNLAFCECGGNNSGECWG
jgi:hypothetical protein